MTPELLQSLSAAKGIPMPIESAQPVDSIAILMRKERRLRDLAERLKRRGDAESIAALERLTRSSMISAFTATGTASRTLRPSEWTHAECAQAAQGLEEKFFDAMRYTYALDDSVFHRLSRCLWEWALERREVERSWPQTIVTQDGKQVRFVRELVEMWLLEVRQPSRFLRLPNQPDIRRVIMHVSEPIWRRRLSPIYAAIAQEFECWLAIARCHMAYRIREECAE